MNRNYLDINAYLLTEIITTISVRRVIMAKGVNMWNNQIMVMLTGKARPKIGD